MDVDDNKCYDGEDEGDVELNMITVAVILCCKGRKESSMNLGNSSLFVPLLPKTTGEQVKEF